jgi:hypothetical protein
MATGTVVNGTVVTGTVAVRYEAGRMDFRLALRTASAGGREDRRTCFGYPDRVPDLPLPRVVAT